MKYYIKQINGPLKKRTERMNTLTRFIYPCHFTYIATSCKQQ